MNQIALPEHTLPSVFRQVLATQSELHRLQIIEEQLAELEDFLEDLEMRQVTPHLRDIRHHLTVVKYYLRLSLTISMIEAGRVIHAYVRRFHRLPLPDFTFLFRGQ